MQLSNRDPNWHARTTSCTPQAGRRALHLAQLAIGDGMARIYKHRHDGGLRKQVVQQPQPFALKFCGE